MIVSVFGAAAVAVIAALIVIRNKPTKYFEGIKILHHPDHGYMYRFHHNGWTIQDGFYPTSNAANAAAWEVHKQLTLTGNPT